jgi:hypothetical protein
VFSDFTETKRRTEVKRFASHNIKVLLLNEKVFRVWFAKKREKEKEGTSFSPYK